MCLHKLTYLKANKRVCTQEREVSYMSLKCSQAPGLDQGKAKSLEDILGGNVPQ